MKDERASDAFSIYHDCAIRAIEQIYLFEVIKVTTKYKTITKYSIRKGMLISRGIRNRETGN